MKKGSFFDNISIPHIEIKSSKLFHTTDNLSNLKKLSFEDVMAPDTASILKKVDGKKATGDFESPKLDSLTEVDNKSLEKLQNIQENFENIARKNAADVGDDSIVYRKTDSFQNNNKASFKNPDDMKKSLKKSNKSSGKSSTDVDLKKNKNKDGVVDDHAADAKKRWDDLKKVVDKVTTYASMTLIAGYMYNLHLNGNAPWSKTEIEEAFSDVEVDVELISYDTDLEHKIRVREQEIRDNNNNEDDVDTRNILIIAAVLIAFVSL